MQLFGLKGSPTWVSISLCTCQAQDARLLCRKSLSKNECTDRPPSPYGLLGSISNKPVRIDLNEIDHKWPQPLRRVPAGMLLYSETNRPRLLDSKLKVDLRVVLALKLPMAHPAPFNVECLGHKLELLEHFVCLEYKVAQFNVGIAEPVKLF